MVEQVHERSTVQVPVKILDEQVNEPITRKERLLFEESLRRGRPLGSEAWVAKTVAKMGLDYTVREEGRPKKKSEN